MGVPGGGLASAAGGDHLVDRVAEQALIAEHLDDPQRGAAILLRGPPGAGKSALAEDAMRRAGPSRRILRTVGTSPEMRLAMAGLHQLLRPLLPLARQISEPRLASVSRCVTRRSGISGTARSLRS
jgi:hypothetical protein